MPCDQGVKREVAGLRAGIESIEAKMTEEHAHEVSTCPAGPYNTGLIHISARSAAVPQIRELAKANEALRGEVEELRRGQRACLSRAMEEVGEARRHSEAHAEGGPPIAWAV